MTSPLLHSLPGGFVAANSFNSSSSSLLPAPSHSSSPRSSSSPVARSPRNFCASKPMSIPAQASTLLPPLPEDRIVLGCGAVSVDFLAAVASYPKPDDKIRSTSAKLQGGGNAGNALTCAARLGLNPRLISKVADDPQGKGLIAELEADGVDTSFLVNCGIKLLGAGSLREHNLHSMQQLISSIAEFGFEVSKGGNSPFTYIIVDNQTKTRTCIHTPGHPPMIPDDLSTSNLLTAIIGARLVYFDGRLHETALLVAQEAHRRGIPILIDAERKREGLDDLLNLSSYIVCSAKFPQAWTEAPSVPSALVSLLLRLPNVKFVIVTLGEEGSVMLERAVTENVQSKQTDADDLFEILKKKKDNNKNSPTCISSGVTKLCAKGIGTVCGTLFVGTAEKIPPGELVDTTGAGDSFIGATLYAICANMPPEIMLPFAAQVAAIKCRALGARTGIPYRTDPRLESFLVAGSQEAATV